MLNELSGQVRSRVHEEVHEGAGHLERPTRMETGQKELSLMPTNGSEFPNGSRASGD